MNNINVNILYEQKTSPLADKFDNFITNAGINYFFVKFVLNILSLEKQFLIEAAIVYSLYQLKSNNYLDYLNSNHKIALFFTYDFYLFANQIFYNQYNPAKAINFCWDYNFIFITVLFYEIYNNNNSTLSKLYFPISFSYKLLCFIIITIFKRELDLNFIKANVIFSIFMYFSNELVKFILELINQLILEIINYTNNESNYVDNTSSKADKSNSRNLDNIENKDLENNYNQSNEDLGNFNLNEEDGLNNNIDNGNIIDNLDHINSLENDSQDSIRLIALNQILTGLFIAKINDDGNNKEKLSIIFFNEYLRNLFKINISNLTNVIPDVMIEYKVSNKVIHFSELNIDKDEDDDANLFEFIFNLNKNYDGLKIKNFYRDNTNNSNQKGKEIKVKAHDICISNEYYRVIHIEEVLASQENNNENNENYSRNIPYNPSNINLCNSNNFEIFKSQYIVTLSHELNNPLQCLKANSKNLIKENDPEIKEKLCTNIKQSLMLITFFFKSLITSTKIMLKTEFYKPGEKKEDYFIEQLIKQLYTKMLPIFQAKNITIDYNKLKLTDLVCNIDSEGFEYFLQNFIMFIYYKIIANVSDDIFTVCISTSKIDTETKTIALRYSIYSQIQINKPIRKPTQHERYSESGLDIDLPENDKNYDDFHNKNKIQTLNNIAITIKALGDKLNIKSRCVNPYNKDEHVEFGSTEASIGNLGITGHDIIDYEIEFNYKETKKLSSRSSDDELSNRYNNSKDRNLSVSNQNLNMNSISHSFIKTAKTSQSPMKLINEVRAKSISNTNAGNSNFDKLYLKREVSVEKEKDKDEIDIDIDTNTKLNKDPCKANEADFNDDDRTIRYDYQSNNNTVNHSINLNNDNINNEQYASLSQSYLNFHDELLSSNKKADIKESVLYKSSSDEDIPFVSDSQIIQVKQDNPKKKESRDKFVKKDKHEKRDKEKQDKLEKQFKQDKENKENQEKQDKQDKIEIDDYENFENRNQVNTKKLTVMEIKQQESVNNTNLNINTMMKNFQRRRSKSSSNLIIGVTTNIQCNCKDILLVDDDISNIDTYKNLLKSFKLAADSCLNGLECLDLLDQRLVNSCICGRAYYKFIIMDYMMPKMNGIECASVIQRMVDDKIYSNKINIVIISAHDTDDMNKKIKLIPIIKNFTPKPVRKTKLSELLNDYYYK